MRKVNAIISLIISLLLLDHAIFKAVWMLSKGGVPQSAPFLPLVMMFLMMVHAIMCIIFAIRGQKGAKKGEGKLYAKLNFATIFQRVSGILLIVFSIFHVLGALGVLSPPPFINAILPPLFFVLALAHVAVSGSKAFITLGIGNAKFIKIADIIIKVICLITLVCDLVGFYLYSI